MNFFSSDNKKFVKKELKKILCYFQRRKITFIFGHDLLHLYTGLFYLEEINDLSKNEKKILTKAWIYHDTGRIYAIKDKKDEHAKYSAIIYKTLNQNDKNFKVIEFIIKNHSQIQEAKLNKTNKLLFWLYIIDTLSLIDVWGNSSILDRIIITKFADVIYDPNSVKGLGKTNSSASNQLEKKIKKTEVDLENIVKAIGINDFIKYAKEKLKIISKIYNNRFFLFVYMLNNIRYLKFFDQIKLLNHYKSLKTLFAANLILKEKNANMLLIKKFEIKEYYSLIIDKYLALEDSNFINKNFKKIHNSVNE